uniref:EamA domain-containing protein n=1 Tax=Trypanosoma congolense (strain IL3000) TaxID=1068625 RepID=G0V0L5_TRYCI|nr:conserved hypothetical protein [Trypanosoma congolense IL3000]
MATCFTGLWSNTRAEWVYWFGLLSQATCNFSLIFAIICLAAVIVGNVVLLIGVNFWLHLLFEKLGDQYNPFALQIVVCLFLSLLFGILTVGYILKCGISPLWRALVEKNRVRGPLYRLFLIFASGATNGVSTVLAIYAMLHTPEFLQAVLMSVIPFFAQVWTYLLVVQERRRHYLSLTVISALLLCIGGILLSSSSSFISSTAANKSPPFGWVFVYFISCVVFGMWCVVQRLYFDAIAIVPEPSEQIQEHSSTQPFDQDGRVSFGQPDGLGPANSGEAGATDVPKESGLLETEELPINDRQWAKQDENDVAAKVLILFLGILFQMLVTFALVPVDAIKGFGSSNGMAHSWDNLQVTFHAIFESWHNLRYGVLHTFGFMLSFVGCAYLNERSPTLASVILQMAAPITSLTLIIVPQWDVFGEHGIVGYKVSGVLMLLIAGWSYHVWDVAFPKAYRSGEKEDK